MIWFLIGHIFSTLISLIRVSPLSEDDKDLEIIILRHQLDVMVREQTRPVKPNRAEKVTLAQLTARYCQINLDYDLPSDGLTKIYTF